MRRELSAIIIDTDRQGVRRHRIGKGGVGRNYWQQKRHLTEKWWEVEDEIEKKSTSFNSTPCPFWVI